MKLIFLLHHLKDQDMPAKAEMPAAVTCPTRGLGAAGELPRLPSRLLLKDAPHPARPPRVQ